MKKILQIKKPVIVGHLIIVFILLSSFLITQSCTPLFSQRAADLFADGKFPKILEDLANPRISKEVAQYVLNQTYTDRMSIAVIDNGTDYRHPDLAKRIRYKISDGKIVGAGYDVMGDDNWAYPSQIDAILFNLGAEGVDDKGRIINPVDDPIKYYDELNSKFVSGLMDRIANDPVLKDSHFNKLNHDNITLTGVYNDLYLTDYKFDLKDYKKNMKKGLLNTRKKLIKDLVEAGSEYQEQLTVKNFRYLFNGNDWLFGTEAGLPRDYNLYKGDASFPPFRSLKGADKYYELVQEYFDEFDKTYHFSKSIENMKKFTLIRNPLAEASSSFLQNFITKIHTSWFNARLDFPDTDPLFNFLWELKVDLLTVEESDYLESEANSVSDKIKFFNERIDIWFNDLQSAYEYKANQAYTDAESIKAYQDSLNNLAAFRKRLANYIKDRDLSFLFSRPKLKPLKDSKALQNYSKTQTNPYFTKSNSTISHGSHTSGTIISQDEGLDIVPVRVLTSKIDLNAHNRDLLMKKFMSEFKDWTEKPLVSHAIYEKMGDIIDPEKNLDISKSGDRVKFSQLVSDYILDDVNQNFIKYSINMEFMNQIRESVKYVGKNKIKLANISLGTTFKNIPTSFDPTNPEKIKNKFTEFIQFEYYKYTLADDMNKYANNTVFYVAAGNEGNWVDGLSRSALPADLSSQFLKKFEQKAGISAPNNHIKNLVTVVSINPENKISSFSNLPLTDNPMIFAPGEGVISSIKTTDIQGSKEEYKLKYGSELKRLYISQFDTKDKEMVKELGLVDLSLPPPKLDEEIENILRRLSFAGEALVDFTNDALETDFILKSTVATASYNGTSMATPHAVGVTGKLIRKKMVQMGLTENQIYDHPEFTPDMVIAMIYDHLGEYGDYSIISKAKTLKNDQVKPFKSKGKTPLGELAGGNRRCVEVSSLFL